MISRVASLLLALALVSGCKRAPGKPEAAGTSAAGSVAAPAVLRVPRTSTPIKLDGELHEPVWNELSARSGAFADGTGGEARPYSDARFLWGGEELYVGLYAADNDIRATVPVHDGPVWTDDAFSLHLAPDVPAEGRPVYGIDISAAGVVTDVKRGSGQAGGQAPGAKDDPSWESGIKLGADRDGTLNDAHDEDEEWVIEASIPLRSLGVEPKPGARLLIDISRCDTPRGTREKRCGALGSPAAPRILELTSER